MVREAVSSRQGTWQLKEHLRAALYNTLCHRARPQEAAELRQPRGCTRLEGGPCTVPDRGKGPRCRGRAQRTAQPQHHQSPS